MNKKRIITLSLVALLSVGMLSVSLFAQNKQEYNMDNALAEHYIELSRVEVNKNQLPLAQLYAQKAVQANNWSKKAWANYNDVIQRLAKKGNLKDFNTFIKESKPAVATGPAASNSESQFEGC